MAGEYAFVMKDLRKVVPPKREILRGIWLSFFHGAKIGVVGANGAGKSTLLRIMAGVDDDFQGEASPAAGLKIGYLSQEPQLDPAKDVRGNVEDGVASTRAPRHAVARRADQSSRRRVGGVAGRFPQGLRGHGRRHYARPLLPRQRRAVDPRARPGARHPVGRQLLVLARAEAPAPGAGRKDRPRPPAHARA